MARFFVDLYHDGEHESDTWGIEYDSLEEAVMEALTAALNLRCQAAEIGVDISEHVFTVRDGAHTVVPVPFSGTLH